MDSHLQAMIESLVPLDESLMPTVALYSAFILFLLFFGTVKARANTASFLTNLSFTIGVTFRLLRCRTDTIHAMHHELKKVPGDIACFYHPRGRIFVIRNGALVPQVTGDLKVFEKLIAPSKNPLGKAVGHAMTTSGDHSIRWRFAKRLMRPIVGSESLQIDAAEAIAKGLDEKLHSWHGKSEVNLYMEVSYQGKR